MKATKWLLAITVIALVAVVAVNISFADKEKEKTGEPSPEDMAKWMEMMAPGGHHKSFANYVGEWDATITMWQAPDMEPQVAKGTSKYKTIMGGRYLVQSMESEMMGMPYEGMGISGFDNISKKHTVLWIDNMGTSITYSEAECAEHCSVSTHNTTVKDPMRGDIQVKMVTRYVDENKHVFEYFSPGPDGKQFKSMEIVYTRG